MASGKFFESQHFKVLSVRNFLQHLENVLYDSQACYFIQQSRDMF